MVENLQNHEVQITKTTCSPGKVPQLQGADRQECDTQEPRCGRGIGSGEKNWVVPSSLLCTFCQILRQVGRKPRHGPEIGSGNLYLYLTCTPPISVAAPPSHFPHQ